MAHFSTEKHIKTFESSIQWNIGIRKNKFLYEKVNSSVGWKKNLGEQHYQKANSIMLVILCTGVKTPA